MFASPSMEELQFACRTLFGPRHFYSMRFLTALDAGSVKRVFRRRVLDCHPDRSQVLGKKIAELEGEFLRVSLAYEILKRYLVPLKRPAELAPENEAVRPREPTPAGSEPPRDHFWRAHLPPKRMLFGQFLYYSGRISWKTLMSAVSWQRKQRPVFGSIARERGYLDPAAIQLLLQNRELFEQIGEAAVRLGYLSRYQRNAVLGCQQKLHRPLREFFIERGVMDDEELEDWFERQKAHNHALLYLP